MRILQHFATKLWNITNFVMLFQDVVKFLSKLVEIQILVIRRGRLQPFFVNFKLDFPLKVLIRLRSEIQHE